MRGKTFQLLNPDSNRNLGFQPPHLLLCCYCSPPPKGVAPNDALMPACHLSCLSAMHIPCHSVLHGFEGSAWSLGECITSGNCRSKHNSLSCGAGADQP